MALQGTLDTFAFADVLRMLAGTGKSGRLELTGDRGTGHVWFSDGALVGGVGPDQAAAEIADVVFQMLRFTEGAFQFDGDDRAESPEGPFAVEDVIGEAEARVAEWQEIEAVLPSMRSQLTLVPELDDEGTVTLDPGQWRLVAAVGAGVTVSDLGRRTGASDLAVCRSVKALVEEGLVEVGQEAREVVAAPAEEPDVAAPVGEVAEIVEDQVRDQDYFSDGSVSHSARARLEAMAATYGAEEPGDGGSILPEPIPMGATVEAEASVGTASVYQPPVDEATAGPQGQAEPDEASSLEAGDEVEMNRQLASLSPKAAEAIAAAAGSLKGEDLHAGRNRLRPRSSSLRR